VERRPVHRAAWNASYLRRSSSRSISHQPAARRIGDLVAPRECEYRIALGAQAGEAQFTLDVLALANALRILAVEPDAAVNAPAI
jgi:hypothetical protein